jgi:hypothetical protein
MSTDAQTEGQGPDDIAGRVRDHFRHQAEACDKLGSPFTASVCRALAEALDDTTATGRRMLSWPGNTREDVLSLRFCGGLHALVLSGADPTLAAAYPPTAAGEAELIRVLPDAIARNDAALLCKLDSAPQTNEIARSAMLLPGFLMIARETGLPLEVHEIGSSGGLNLLFDRFAYDYAGTLWGDAGSPVRLAPEVRGAAPNLQGTLTVLGRIGSDIRPIRVAEPAERLRLRSYIWADQLLRLARLDAAIGLAEKYPFALEQSDGASFVTRMLTNRRPGVAQVLFHSIMWQYMPEAMREAAGTALVVAGLTATSDAPIAWLRMEPLDTRHPYATLTLTTWPGGETRHLARCDYHGRWIEWIAEG